MLSVAFSTQETRILTRFACFFFPINSEDRVRNGAARLDKLLATKQQGRLDGFFKSLGTVSSKTASSKAEEKEEKAKGGKKRKVSPRSLSSAFRC